MEFFINSVHRASCHKDGVTPPDAIVTINVATTANGPCSIDSEWPAISHHSELASRHAAQKRVTDCGMNL